MKNTPHRRYTIRGVPADVDRKLRLIAKARGASLNTVVIDALRLGLALGDAPRYHDLDWFSGTWQEDPAVDDALAAQQQIDPGLWRDPAPSS